MLVTPPLTEMGSGTVLCELSSEVSGCGNGLHCTFRRGDKTGSGRRASDSTHHSRSDNTS